MRSLWLVAILVATALAGCTSGGDAASDEGPQVRIALPDGPLVAGQEIRFSGQAHVGAEFIRWQWDLGDGTVIDGRSVLHTYLFPDTYNVTLKAADDAGHFATDRATIEVVSAGTVPPSPPGPNGSAAGPMGHNLSLADGEPTVGDTYSLRWEGPAFENLTGRLTVYLPDGAVEHDVSRSATIEVVADEAGPQRIAWIFDGQDAMVQGEARFDVWGEPIDFGGPSADQWLRPGVQTVADGAQCTTNFLFHHKWYRFFIGSAAHCVDDTDINEICQSGPTAKLGSEQSVSGHDGRSVTTTLAYSSWITMEREGGGSCPANDFALYEIGADGQAVMHPKALFYGGPSSLAPMAGYGTGTTLYGYGASQLHGNLGVGYPGQDEANSKRGISLGTDNGGYSQHLYFALPGVPGDSGGPAFGPGGEALGALSTITLSPTPASNRYTVIPKALAYMEENEGWAPELITHDSFSATGG